MYYLKSAHVQCDQNISFMDIVDFLFVLMLYEAAHKILVLIAYVQKPPLDAPA